MHHVRNVTSTTFYGVSDSDYVVDLPTVGGSGGIGAWYGLDLCLSGLSLAGIKAYKCDNADCVRIRKMCRLHASSPVHFLTGLPRADRLLLGIVLLGFLVRLTQSGRHNQQPKRKVDTAAK